MLNDTKIQQKWIDVNNDYYVCFELLPWNLDWYGKVKCNTLKITKNKNDQLIPRNLNWYDEIKCNKLITKNKI